MFRDVLKIWFDDEYIYAENASGKVLKQSLLWYDRLRKANDAQRSRYTIGFDGIHWRELDEDISFESFEYADAEPTSFQRFFLTHKDIDITEFANRIGLNVSTLRGYINGISVPSEACEHLLLDAIARYGKE